MKLHPSLAGLFALLMAAFVSVTANSAVNGTDFSDSLSASVIGTVVGLTLVDTQNGIGTVIERLGYKEGSPQHAILHGVAGCAAAVAQGGACAAGAAGGIAGSVASRYFKRNPIAVDPTLSAAEASAQRRELEQRYGEVVSAAMGYVFSGGVGENVVLSH